MKINATLLTFWAFLPTATTAFISQPTALFKGYKTSNASPSFSYLGNLGASESSSSFSDSATSRYSLDKNVPKNVGVSKADANQIKKIWENSSQVLVQGGTLKTWSFLSNDVESVQIRLQTEGRPLDADVELWQGPDNTPHKIRIYIEDGRIRPFSCVMMTPRGPNTIAIRNTAQMEFPLAASVVGDTDEEGGPLAFPKSSEMSGALTIQGGALRTYPFLSNVESVQVLLKTDGRPLSARIELLQGPNNNKEVIEVYTEDGLDRPFYVVIETPGSGNVVRIVNLATVEFPLSAVVEPFVIGEKSSSKAVISGDSRGPSMGDWMKGQ
jgi:hypothetical protein